MHNDLLVEEWETPFSHARSVGLVSLTDDGRLSFSLQVATGNEILLLCITFLHYPVYRVTSEKARIGQRKLRGITTKDVLGWSFTLPKSSWIESINAEEKSAGQPLTHYMICTEEQFIEVASNSSPTISQVGKSQLNTASALARPRLAEGLSRTAFKCLENGKVAEAEELFSRLIRIRERTQGCQHADLIRLLQGYAQVLLTTRRQREAQKVQKRVRKLIAKLAAQVQEDAIAFTF